MSQELKLYIINTPYVNRNVYFKIQFIGLPIPNGTTSPFDIVIPNGSPPFYIEKRLTNPIIANMLRRISGDVRVDSDALNQNVDMIGHIIDYDNNVKFLKQIQNYLLYINQH